MATKGAWPRTDGRQRGTTRGVGSDTSAFGEVTAQDGWRKASATMGGGNAGGAMKRGLRGGNTSRVGKGITMD